VGGGAGGGTSCGQKNLLLCLHIKKKQYSRCEVKYVDLASLAWNFFVIRGIFVLFFDQHCLICLPLDSNVSADAGIEPRTVATLALAVRRFNLSDIDLIHLARPYPGILYLQTVHIPQRLLKVHKNEKFFGFDFEFCTI
jgi:hypothetical protein